MIKELIEQQLLNEQEDRSKRERSGKWNPSSFGKCFRAQVWNRKNEPVTNPIELTGLKKMRAGTLFHEFARQTLKYTPGVQFEVCVETEDVKGYADIILPEDVIDIKSMHSWAFNHLPAKLEDIRHIKTTDVLQVTFYAKELKKNYWTVSYISKDDMRFEEYHLPLTEEDKKNVDFELEILRKYWAQTELPPAQPRAYMNKDGKYAECGYCSWRDLCVKTETEAGRKHYIEKDKS